MPTLDFIEDATESLLQHGTSFLICARKRHWHAGGERTEITYHVDGQILNKIAPDEVEAIRVAVNDFLDDWSEEEAGENES